MTQCFARLGFVGFVYLVFFFTPATGFSQCGTVANDFSMKLPCVEYGGAYFSLTLTSYTNPSDPAGLYWQFDTISPAAAAATCAQTDADLNITAPCVYFSGINLSIFLEKFDNPAGPDNLYWKMGNQYTVNPVTISEISGDTTPCIDPSIYADPQFLTALNESITCINQCGQDPACISACMPDLGMGSAFSLAFTFDNPSASPVSYTVPAGAYYEPGKSGVQPMLVVTDQVNTLEPGSTTVCIPTYCMDSQADSPSAGDIFSVGDITQKSCLLEIINLLRDSGDLSMADSSTIQDAVWSCMETGAISDTQRAAMDNM